MIIQQRTRLIYILHSGNLYGTERMALMTIDGLRGELIPILLAPPGPIHDAAKLLKIDTHEFTSAWDLFKKMPLLLRSRQSIAICATGVSHSLLFMIWNYWFKLKTVHLHLVHGGTDERLSYGRKKILNYFPISIVAVSNYVKQRLLVHGVRDQQITVLENFLPDKQITAALKRPPFKTSGIIRVLIISRIDPIKRIDLLLEALDLAPHLSTLDIRILGAGSELDILRERARLTHANVTFVGFTHEVEDELFASDLLLHLCPTEPFGLAILEAMAAKLPVLLPNQGGAANLIESGISGLHFNVNDVHDLIRQLTYLQTANASDLNKLADNAYQRLLDNYSSTIGLKHYLAAFNSVAKQ